MEKPPVFLIVTGVLIVGSFFVFGRGDAGGISPPPSQSVTKREAAEGAVAGAASAASQPDGPQVPDLNLTSLAGETVNLNQFIGQKAVIVDFWASWCPNCQRDMPKMQMMYDTYKDNVEILAINLQEPKRDIERFVSSRKFTYPILLDPAGKASHQFGISYTNTHILISKSGKIFSVLPGDISEDNIKELIAAS